MRICFRIESFLQLEKGFEPTLEVADQRIGAAILLTRSGQMARGKVVALSYDTHGYVLDRINANPILDTRLY